MFQLRVSSQASTTIAVRLNILSEVGTAIREVVTDVTQSPVVCITDHRVEQLYATGVLRSLESAGLRTNLYAVEPGEASKNLATAGDIFSFLTKERFDRDGIILALGGGVVSDLAGFVAATWMRGVRLVICPTTMEADVDAAIGGKTAVNIPGAKNLVGAFHHPVLVAIDHVCLKTLDLRDVRAGLAESLKHALISSPEFLAWHEDHVDDILALGDPCIAELIERNLRTKAAIVEQDPYEQTGLRMHLNFGHTIGHAIEECSEFSLRHGECVALGLLAACRLSSEMGLLESAAVERGAALLRRFGLPTQLAEPIDAESILATMYSDKKARGGAVQFVLLEAIGRPTIRADVPESLVRGVYESLLP